MLSRVYVMSTDPEDVKFFNYDEDEISDAIIPSPQYVMRSDVSEDINSLKNLYFRNLNEIEHFEKDGFVIYKFKLQELFDSMLHNIYNRNSFIMYRIKKLELMEDLESVEEFSEIIDEYVYDDKVYFYLPGNLSSGYHTLKLLDGLLREGKEYVYIYQTFDYHI